MLPWTTCTTLNPSWTKANLSQGLQLVLHSSHHNLPHVLPITARLHEHHTLAGQSSHHRRLLACSLPFRAIYCTLAHVMKVTSGAWITNCLIIQLMLLMHTVTLHQQRHSALQLPSFPTPSHLTMSSKLITSHKVHSHTWPWQDSCLRWQLLVVPGYIVS